MKTEILLFSKILMHFQLPSEYIAIVIARLKSELRKNDKMRQDLVTYADATHATCRSA